MRWMMTKNSFSCDFFRMIKDTTIIWSLLDDDDDDIALCNELNIYMSNFTYCVTSRASGMQTFCNDRERERE